MKRSPVSGLTATLAGSGMAGENRPSVRRQTNRFRTLLAVGEIRKT
jgi:hypothetical protein